MFETIDYQVEDGVAVIRLNRPHRHNAINAAMHRELPRAWQHFNRDPAAVVAIFTGAGERAFCTGADIDDLPEVDTDAADSAAAMRWTARHNAVWKPVICAVNGMAVGGGLHFIADSDIVIAADTATFSDSHVSVGLVAGLEPVTLSRRMPLESVLRMALVGGGERLDAQRARELGMISEAVPAERLLARAQEIAALIKRNSPAAMARTKQAIWQAQELPLEDALNNAWRLIARHNAGPDFAEGVRAFLERRAPRWPQFSEE